MDMIRRINTSASVSVSIIMPVFNMPLKELRRALSSAITQTGMKNRVEAIVCDDGSDGIYRAKLCDTVELFSSYLPITLCLLDAHHGISYARNFGARLAKGDWLVWLDGDDELASDAISSLLAKAQDTNASMVISDCLVVEGDHRQVRSPSSYLEFARKYHRTRFDPLAQVIFSLQAQCVRATYFHEIGGFSVLYRYAEVTEFFLRFVSSYGLRSIEYVPRPLYVYYRRSLSHSSNRDELDTARRRALESYARRCGIQFDSIVYWGRSSNTACPHYRLSVSGQMLTPPYAFESIDGITVTEQKFCN